MKSGLLFFAFLLFSTLLSSAQEDSQKEEKSEKKEEKTIADTLKDSQEFAGLFTLHQNQKNGKVFLEIATDQLGEKFIYFSHTLDGVPDLGLFRGQFTRALVFRIVRHFDRIEFVRENTGFYFNPDSALGRAAEANVSDAILATQKIESSDEKRILVEADSIFLKELFRQIKPSKSKEDKKERFELGELSKEKTRFVELKNFPDNSLLRVQYVYENPRPVEEGESDVADSRFVTIRVQHTLMAAPENDYKPRFDDPRVGYFTTQVTDLTSKSSVPFRDLIHRWNLQKKDPAAEISDPVEPITWWIENTTPHELRDTIRTSGLAWNEAFESAGISNAIEIKIQPDDAEWDADDIRYHVLRWTSSPNPPFGGYGPSFVNPETGQILGSDIMLEYIFLTNRIRLRQLLEVSEQEASDRGLPFPFHRAARRQPSGFFCQMGNHLQLSNMAARATLQALGNDAIEVDALIEQALSDLVLHEIGHTLGLNHNFRSSHLYNREEIHDTERTGKTGVIASVMDYAPANLSRDRSKQGHYYSIKPGPYDHWAIRFGYTPPAPNQDEGEMIRSILAESTKPEHAFANDADDMREAGRGIDPRAMINDLTNEPIEHAIDQIEMTKETLDKLADKFPKEGESYHELRVAFYSLMRQLRNGAETISRFVGGVEVERAFHNQPGNEAFPFHPVNADRQKQAMDALATHIFAPDAFRFSPKLISRLQLQRRGFDMRDLDDNEDPKIHNHVIYIQKKVLDQLLHKHTLGRILDSAQYGNGFGLQAVFQDLHRAILEGDPDNEANSFREALQIEYVRRLISISGLKEKSDYPTQAQSLAVLALQNLSKEVELRFPESHGAHIRRLAVNALNP